MTTLIWCAVIGACVSYWWTRYGNKMFGIGPLPPGYNLIATDTLTYPQLKVYKDHEFIAQSRSISNYGYRSCARVVTRAAWAHYNMTKVEDAK